MHLTPIEPARLRLFAVALFALLLSASCQTFADWHDQNSGTYIHTSEGTQRVQDVVVDDEGFVEVHQVNGEVVPLSRSARVRETGTTVQVATGPTRSMSFSTDSRTKRMPRLTASWSGEAGDALEAAKASIASGSPMKAFKSLYRASSSAPRDDLDFKREVEATWGDLRVAQGQFEKAFAHYDTALKIGDVGSSARHDIERRRREALRESGRAKPLAWRERTPTPSLTTSTWTPSAAPVVTAKTPVVSVAGPISVRPRSAWGARPMKGNAKRMSYIDRITVHHSVCCSHAVHPREAVPFLRSIQTDHMDGHGWADIGYHFVIDTGGNVWEGRALTWQGAHAGNDALNAGNIGICLLGDFDTQLVDGRQRRALEGLLVGMQSRYRVPVARVFTHQELKPTECPGANLQRHMDEYRQRERVVARQ